MTTNLVLTIIGDDEPGLVESLSQIIAENSGHWLESSMSLLAGKFAGILRVSVEDNCVDTLIAELEKLSGKLKLVIEKTNIEHLDTRTDPASQQVMELNLVGNDRPGIIKEISRALAAYSINFEELNTQCTNAPMSGEILFKAQALLKVPPDLDLDGLQSELEKIADDLIVEISLE